MAHAFPNASGVYPVPGTDVAARYSFNPDPDVKQTRGPDPHCHSADRVQNKKRIH